MNDTKKLTTAELFATAKLPLGWFGDQGKCCREAHEGAEAALVELEHRVGAMGSVMRAAVDALRRIGKTSAADPLTGDQCRDLVKTREALESALTDAPVVFTLEEVDDALQSMRNSVMERLSAMRIRKNGPEDHS